MYSKFFRTGMLILFAVFVLSRMLISQSLLLDGILLGTLILVTGLSAGGLIWDRQSGEAEHKSYKNFTIAFGVCTAVFVLMLVYRYVISA